MAMHRKLRKLLRDPRKFLLDIRLFGWPARIAKPRPRLAAPLRPRPEHTAKDYALITEAAPVSEGALMSEDKPLADPAVAKAPPLPRIEGYESFELHGPNWLDGTDKPVAVLWGFAVWQRPFVAQYFPDNRTAFVTLRTRWSKLEASLDRLEGVRFIAWGSVEDQVRDYAQRRGFPMARMADGFIRSASLSRYRTCPYSMALDESGLASDAAQPSGLERLLDGHDFGTSQSLLNSVPALMQLHRQLGISKYNPGSFRSASHLLGPKLMHRILVVGEKPREATSEHGTVGTWTPLRLIALAVADNPQAEVIFRPHPDDARAYRKGSEGLAQLEHLCRVIAEDVSLPDLLHAVDQVYVDTSLVGLEALIHGLPVTVVGTPFYAGWGLTDDRQEVPRRARRLSLQELYCAAYLLYPRYLADLDDPVTGCLATMIRVAAERRQALDTAVTSGVERHATSMALTDYWPTLLRPDNLGQLTGKHGKKILTVFSIPRAFADSRAVRFQRSVAYLIVGQFHKVPEAAGFLKQMRTSVRTDVFRQVLLDLRQMNPSAAVLEQLAWCCQQDGDFGQARALLEHLAFGGDHKQDPDCLFPFPMRDHPRVIRLAEFELNQKQFDRSEQLFNWLLLSGGLQPEVFLGLAHIARLRFDFTSATLLLGIARRLHPTWKLGKADFEHAQACALTQDAVSSLESIALACLKNPQFLASAPSTQYVHVLDLHIGVLPYDQALVLVTELGESDNVIGRARGLITHERPADAERLLLSNAPHPSNVIRHALTLSMAYSFQGKLADAKALVSRLLTTSPDLSVYHEGLRLAVMANDYTWGKALLNAARERHLDVGELLERKIALGLGEVKESYLKLRQTKAAKRLREYLGAKYVQSLHSLSREPSGKNLVLAFSGPGDEIRFTTFYAAIQAAVGDSRLVFTCDPRILGLLSRHYTQFEFVPSARIRFLPRLKNFDTHDQLPGSDLHVFFDNRGWAEAEVADRVILVHDALGDVIDGYASFDGGPSLKADPALVHQWRDRLPHKRHGELLVGLSWRSSLLSFVRNEHYLAIEDLLPLFELEGVRFVNLQYDDCQAELAWLEARLPGRLLHFGDLDQFNDLDGVAALMECLDLVIAPATTVVELAGALGRPTLFLSNSSEMHWRKIPGSRVDVWRNSILHVEAPVLGDKHGLVGQLVIEVQRRVEACQRSVAAID